MTVQITKEHKDCYLFAIRNGLDEQREEMEYHGLDVDADDVDILFGAIPMEDGAILIKQYGKMTPEEEKAESEFANYLYLNSATTDC